ncbi:MAG: type II toxin-antitoxin system RelE/ParE family toxin [Verrucomicrobia bacterium]|nr:type II toxin-antitoxin system RelE/ParE family toxin [Verrucomicrobiota bacterium]MDE3098501.1 type II toxin-antitoxin system RelE/ParE family toxin [Verrucomicrobiota bacterium]
MNRRFVLRRVAEQEFEHSIAWYENQRKSLGQKFRSTIEDYFQQIADHPEWFTKVRGEVRRAVVRRFPFVIHFLVEKEGIVILSVFHTSRDPEQLKYRR